MSIGPWQIIIIAVLLLVLFGGRGKISNIMGDLAKGIKSFKTNIKEDDEAAKIETNDQPTAAPAVAPAAEAAPVAAAEAAPAAAAPVAEDEAVKG